MTADKGYKFHYLKSLHRVKFPSPNYYRVLVTLLDHAKADGSGARPGNPLLAELCAVSEDTVERALTWLRKNGFITLTMRSRRTGQASVYSFPGSDTNYRNTGRGPRTHAGKEELSDPAPVPVLPASGPRTGAPPTDKEQRTGAEQTPRQAVVTNVISTSASAEWEDPWVSTNSVDSMPVVGPVVGPLLKSSACGGELIEDISKGDGICCFCDCAIINQPSLDYGGVPAHHRCVYSLDERERWACPHCPSGYFATAEELNTHARVHQQPAAFEAAAPW